jgi:hypothetical protein
VFGGTIRRPRLVPHSRSRHRTIVNTVAPPPIDWLSLLVIAVTAAVMIYLFRRLMRGMNQQDWILLRQARQRGIDPAKPQSVDFVLFLASLDAANRVSEELRKDGFETSMKEAQIQYARNRAKPGDAQWGYLVTARRQLKLYPAELAKLRTRFNAVAGAESGIYCGWQVSTGAATASAEQKKQEPA